MGYVSVDSDAVISAIKQCEQIREELIRQANYLKKRYDFSGEGWKDEKRKQIGQILDKCTEAIKKPIIELDKCLRALKNLSDSIIKYESVDLQAINHMYTDTTIQTALGIAGRVAVSGFGVATGLSDPTGSASATAAQAFQIAGPVAIEAFTRMMRGYINVNSTNTDIFYRDHFMRTHDGIPITPEQGREIAINEMVSTLTGNSVSVINVIANEEQLQIYMEAGLEYSVVNSRECLVRDIDPDFIDKKTGLTNRELMLLGRAPYDSDTGERIELHHMGQTFDAPFAELAENSEHGDGNFNALHQSRSESWRNNPALCNEYARQRRMHWIARGGNL